MKPTLLSTLLFLITFQVFSQSSEALKTSMTKLYEANYLMDFETIDSYLYPKLATTLGATEVLEAVERHYENDDYRLRLQLEMVPFQYSEIKKIEGRSFCVITCRNPMRYTFEKKLTAERIDEKTTMLKESHKTKEVTFEPNRNSFNVRATTTFVAVADETTKNQWAFFNFDDTTQKIGFDIFFNADIRKELGL